MADVAERKWRVLASGPVRSIGEYEYKGWKIGGKTIDMVSRFTQWAGEHGFEHRVTVSNPDGHPSGRGAPEEARHPPGAHRAGARTRWQSITWGPQVVVPGTKAGTTELPNEDLGLALVVRNDQSETHAGGDANYLFPLMLQNSAAEWYVAAMWDQENTEALAVNARTPAERNQGGTLVPNAPRATRERFARVGHRCQQPHVGAGEDRTARRRRRRARRPATPHLGAGDRARCRRAPTAPRRSSSR